MGAVCKEEDLESFVGGLFVCANEFGLLSEKCMV